MNEIILFLKNNLSENFMVYFIPLYILGGRPVALLSGQLIGINIFFLLSVVVLLDIIQVPFFYYLYDSVSKNSILTKLYARAEKKEALFRSSRVFRWIRLMGTPGVLTIAVLPLKGCGMWSGVLLSKLLKLSKQISYPLLITGSVVGCLLVLGAGEAILQFFRMIYG